jgi:hypothetical protein
LNPAFQGSDVKERRSEVLGRVREWREAKVRWTIMAAAIGKCYSLNLERGMEGKTAVTCVGAALDIGGMGWSEAGFVGAVLC